MRAVEVGRRRLAVAVASMLCAWFVVAVAPVAASAVTPPSLSVASAILVAPGTGQRLYAVDPNAERQIASTTKLMTALVTLEHVRHLDEIFTAPDYYSASDDSQIGITPGERMTVHDLLLALMLPSADDAAEDLAYNVGDGSVARFVGMMNARARQLGLTHTHYSTPIGLDAPGNYSSASDLVKLAAYELQHNRFFAHIVGLPSATLDTGPAHYVVNRNDLVRDYSWINGVKTGHTSGAGYVLVASATRNGMTLLSAVLGTDSEDERDANTLALLNYGFDNFRYETPVRAGESLARATVRDRTNDTVGLLAAGGYSRVLADSAQVRLRVVAPHALTGPLKFHAAVGYVLVRLDGHTLARVPLVLARALAPPPSQLAVAARFITRPFTLLVVLVLLGLAAGLVLRRRGQTRARRAVPSR